MDNSNVPEEYKPISAWGYFGYNLLFNIPIVGFILLIVFSFDSSNINRRNYARSFFIVYLIALIIIILIVVISLVCGISFISQTNNLSF